MLDRSDHREQADQNDGFTPRPVPPRPDQESLRKRLSTSARRTPNTGRTRADRSELRWFRRRPPIWALAVATVLLSSAVVLPKLGASAPDTFAWPKFVEKVTGGQVRQATFRNGSGVVVGVLVDGAEFQTTGPTDLSPEERRTLGAATDLRFTPARSDAVERWAPIVVSLVVLAIALLLFLRRRGADASKNPLTKSRARVGPGDHLVTFADVAGAQGPKDELAEIVDVLRHSAKYHAMGARLPKGVLLVGPPGTGKTLLARAVAGEAGVPFLSISGSDFMEMYVGVGAARVRDLFREASRCAPCVIFIDEIDSVGRKRGAGLGGGHDEREQTLNQLLTELDGFSPTSGVVVLGATNRPDVLDDALLRAGRFDRHIEVSLPDRDERQAILGVHGAGLSFHRDVDLGDIARATPGMSGAQLSQLLNESTLGAIRRGADEISSRDIHTALDRVLLGVERASFVLSSEERRIVAVHESGHAVLATLLPTTGSLQKVSIIPRGPSLGVTISTPADRTMMSQSDALDQLCLLFGGRAAEHVVFGALTSGAADDLRKASALARTMVREWGMSERIGPMAWQSDNHVFLGEQMQRSRDESAATAQIVDEEIRRILSEQQQRATDVLTRHRLALDALTALLLDEETVSGERVRKLVSR
jgi:cell division protease FtsH